MLIGIPAEKRDSERRVAVVPEGVRRLTEQGHEVLVEAGAGAAAGYPDEQYEQAGARLVDAEAIWRSAVVAKVERPLPDEIDRMEPGSTLVALLHHHSNRPLVEALASRSVTAFAMDWMPRTTRAQEMDARSSMTTIQGYKAVLLAADALPRMMPMLITAAGTVTPAHVLVIGVGVAGLSAIATARRLGGVVEGFDVRDATREQVESLGARFLAMDSELEATQDAQGYATAQSNEVLELERQTIGRRLPSTDIVITTALVPGREPPRLITREMVESMPGGAVIVDLAAPAGGNCQLTEAGRCVVHKGVTVIGYTDLESRVPFHSSQLYSRNVVNYLLHLLHGDTLELDLEDVLIRFPLITHGGEVVTERPQGGS